MNYAVDKFSGLLVEASHASPLRKRYKCPICNADAHVRMGIHRRPHFAHDSGAASINCENYHCSEVLCRGFDSTYLSIQRHLPNLYVRLSDNQIDNPLSWDLMLLIPECPQSLGSVEITEAQYGTVTIPVTHLAQGGKRVCVRPEITYQIKVRGQIDPTYEEMISKPISGLDKLCNVFQYSKSGGRKLHDNQILYWGRSYFLVWNRNNELKWLSGLEKLLRTNLSPNSEWNCDIIKIPADEDFRVSKWAEEVLHRRIGKPPVKLSILNPIGNLTLEDESFLVSTTDEIILSVTGDLGAVVPSELHLKLPTSHTIISIKLNGPLPVIISIGRLPLGRTEIWSSDNQESYLCLCAVEFDQGYYIQGVGFIFEKLQQKRQVFTPVHSQLAQPLLDEVRQGLTSLISVTIPRRVSTTIRFRERSDTRWQESIMAVDYIKNTDENAVSHKEYEERVRKEILAQLSKNKGELEIDFDNYGKVNLKLTYDRLLDSFTLPSYRLQLSWIISLLQSMNSRDKFSSGESLKQLKRCLKQISIERFEHDDRVLINRLLKYDCVPMTIEVNMRSLVNRICRDLKELEMF